MKKFQVIFIFDIVIPIIRRILGSGLRDSIDNDHSTQRQLDGASPILLSRSNMKQTPRDLEVSFALDFSDLEEHVKHTRLDTVLEPVSTYSYYL